jgi:VanZ family protein
MPHRLRWLLVALAWMLIIFWFSSQPQLPGFADDFLEILFKKGSHALAYGILWTLLWLGTGRPWLALVISLIYAISDELHQTFVPGRNGWWVDVAVDAVGALLAFRFGTGRWGHQFFRRLGVEPPLDHDITE